MKKAYFYVGHNNATKKLEKEKIYSTVAEHFDGFTASEVIGYWKGAKEKTLKVEVVTDESDAKLVQCAKSLRLKLAQEAVMLEIVESNVAFITE